MNDIGKILDKTYQWSSKHGFKGFNKHDALNSPLLRVLTLNLKWLRIIAIQLVMRFPFNLRPLFFVERSYNPKGLGLFVSGLLDRYETRKSQHYVEEAEKILKLLLQIRSPGDWSGSCWGYHYPWQDPFFFGETNTPNAIVTVFVCEAFLDAYRITGKPEYLDVVSDASRFLLNDLPLLLDTPDELCIGYMPVDMEARVMDVSILIGSVLAQLAVYRGDDELLNTSYRLVNYVVNRQTKEGAWFYTDPPEASLIKHDNYHTGFILDGLDRYMKYTNDRRFEESYERGLVFYADKLFNSDGSPRWRSDEDFPHDIHGAAQGIITFSRHMDRYGELVTKIAQWTIGNMYSPEGRFYYQKNRWMTKKFTLLRWCNAWSFRAFARYEHMLGKEM